MLLPWCEHVHDDVRPDLAWLVCDLLYHRRECLIDDVEPCPDRLNVPLELIGCQSAIQTLALWECRDLEVCQVFERVVAVIWGLQNLITPVPFES